MFFNDSLDFYKYGEPLNITIILCALIVVCPLTLIIWILNLTTKSSVPTKVDFQKISLQFISFLVLSSTASLSIWWIFFNKSEIEIEGSIEFFGHIAPPFSISGPLFMFTLLSTWRCLYLIRRAAKVSFIFHFCLMLTHFGGYVITDLSLLSAFGSNLPTIK